MNRCELFIWVRISAFNTAKFMGIYKQMYQGHSQRSKLAYNAQNMPIIEYSSAV